MRAGTCDRCGEPFEDRSRGQNRRWCSENCRKRCCDDAARAACPGCGEPMGAKSAQPSHAGRQCDDCNRLDQAADRCGRLIGLYLLWQRGVVRTEVAERVGFTPASVSVRISKMRAAGVTLDYRLPTAKNPTVIAALHAGRDAWRAREAA